MLGRRREGGRKEEILQQLGEGRAVSPFTCLEPRPGLGGKACLEAVTASESCKDASAATSGPDPSGESASEVPWLWPGGSVG